MTLRTWERTEVVGLFLWAAAIVCVSVSWNQWAMAQVGLDKAIGLIAASAFVTGVPFVFGAIAELLIRRPGQWLDLFVLAAVGAALVGLSLAAQWSSDLRACGPGQDQGCDVAFGLGGAFVSILCFWPFLAGAAAGRGCAVLGRFVRERQ
jgi:ABC-type thiamin/hydroxymethylpyrimidine transport system permease subunit